MINITTHQRMRRHKVPAYDAIVAQAALSLHMSRSLPASAERYQGESDGYQRAAILMLSERGIEPARLLVSTDMEARYARLWVRMDQGSRASHRVPLTG